MTIQVFTLVLNRRPTDDELDGLHAAGCDDAIFGQEDGLSIGEFDREAPTLADAIATAVIQIEQVGLAAVRVLDTDLVTLADIGTRIGQSRESVRRYATGERGPGGFPPPANPARDGTVSIDGARLHRGCEISLESLFPTSIQLSSSRTWSFRRDNTGTRSIIFLPYPTYS